MSDSLSEQLRKAGFATKKQVKAADREMREQAKQARKHGTPDEASSDATEIAQETARILRERAARDKELNRQREAKHARDETLAQIRDWVARRRILSFKGPIAHHFVDGTRVKHLDVTEEVHRELAEGHLAIVILDGEYALIPTAVAEKVLERAPEFVVLLNAPPCETEREKPSEDCPVPDDLMW